MPHPHFSKIIAIFVLKRGQKSSAIHSSQSITLNRLYVYEKDDTAASVVVGDGKGYDMSYKGFIPIASCIFQEGRLYSYQYEFYFDRDVHTKASVEAMAKAFVSALKKGGISLPKNFSDDSYAVSGDYGSRSIIVAVHDIEDEPYKILINILVEQ